MKAREDTPQISARDERSAYRAVHGKKVVLDALKAAAVEHGWKHSQRISRQYGSYDQFVRGNWILDVFWSQGGRIHGWDLREVQIDPDTGKVARWDGGRVKTWFRQGGVAGERDKKGKLLYMLSSPPNWTAMRHRINEVHEQRIAEDRARKAERESSGRLRPD